MAELNDTKIDITNSEALELAQKYLAGQWGQLKAEDIELSVLSGGWCARLYICENKSGSEELDGVPNKFLIRLYGTHFFPAQDIFTLNKLELTVLFYHLGELDLGAKLLGVFEGGRLESLIRGRNLTIDDLNNPIFRLQIARKLARIHNIKVPMSQKKMLSLESFRKQYAESEHLLPEMCELSKQFGCDPKWATEFDWRMEMDWMERIEGQIEGRLVTSTNDMNLSNCLIRETPDRYGELITLIDVELGSINYRSYDIAGHFLMRTRSPYPYPEPEIRAEFARNYLAMWKELNGPDSLNPTIDTVEHLMLEIDFGIFYVLHWFNATLITTERIKRMEDPKTREKLFAIAAHMAKVYKDRKKYFIETYGAKFSL